MVKIRDLRIGNILEYEYERGSFKQGHVTNLNSSNKICIDGKPFKLHPLSNSVAPVPITKEWLINFGFEPEAGYKGTWIKQTIGREDLRIDLSDGVFVATGIRGQVANSMTFHHIRCVHHLQNFWLAYVGEELTINS